MTERERFEEWASGQHRLKHGHRPVATRSVDYPEMYAHIDVQIAWEDWQAATKAERAACVARAAAALEGDDEK